MIKAVIDIGTNSIKLCIAKIVNGEIFILKDINKITKLGEGLQKDGSLGKEAIERTLLEAVNYVQMAKASGAIDIKIVGTMAIRSAKNKNVIQKRLKELTNIDLKIISGEDEARLSFLSVLSGFPVAQKNKVVTLDVGGGSSDIVFSDKGIIKRKISVDVGAIELTEKYFLKPPMSPKKLMVGQKAIREEFLKQEISEEGAILIGIGGTITTMAAIKAKMSVYDAKIQGMPLSLEEIERQISLFASKNIEERSQIVGLNPARAEIILAGACIVREIMRLCKSKEILVSDKGLRHALFIEGVSY